jgi:ABC-type glycerol-3-phosphate transport system substrate-binding protein
MERTTRRRLLKSTLAATALARPALAQGKPEKLVFVGDNGPWHYTLVEEVAPAFEKATGVKVEFTLLPIDALNARLKSELAAGSGGIDVIQWTTIWAGWMAPFMEDHDKLAAAGAADYDIGDFLPAARQMASYDGKLLGIPYRATMGILHYQKALLEQAGFAKPPGTFAEFLNAAEALTKSGAPDRYGVGIMGRQGPAMVGSFSPFLFSNGGSYLDTKTWEIAINDAHAVEALEYYGDLLTKYKVVPPEALTWEFDEIVANGQSDRYAMTVTLAPYGTLMNDPKLSKTGGKWAAATMPGAKTPEQGRTWLSGWIFGVASACKNKELAFQFIQMATNKQWMRRSMERGNLAPRASVLRDPAVVEKLAWAPAAATALETARPDPQHPVWPTLENQLRSGISQVLLGQRTSKQALDAVASDWQRSLRRAGVVK